jgi:hypothetical protein
MLLDAFESRLQRFRQMPAGAHGYVAYSPELQADLDDGGFMDVAGSGGFGLLEAALLVEAAAANCPVSVEVAASTLVGPLIEVGQRPLAIAWGLGTPARFLGVSRTVCVMDGDDVHVGSVVPEHCKTVDSVVAYPLATLAALPPGAQRFTGAKAAAIRRRAYIGIAAEAAGLMRGALELTVQYVKDRKQFGQPLGHFQAIQHRLAEDVQLIQASRLLALRAAYSDADKDAATACLYAQEAIRKVMLDCHQFSGAMGLTLEYPLHLWTYRLKFLQGEGGGKARHGRELANLVWIQAGRQEEGSWQRH